MLQQQLAEFEQMPFSIGRGLGKCSRNIAPPNRQLPQSTLAKVRRQRLARRLSIYVPMFANSFIQQQIEKKLDYYNRIMDAILKKHRMQSC